MNLPDVSDWTSDQRAELMDMLTVSLRFALERDLRAAVWLKEARADVRRQHQQAIREIEHGVRVALDGDQSHWWSAPDPRES